MENLDTRLVGKWRRTESHSDMSYSFSYVIDYYMEIREDETISLTTRSMGGTDSVMGETPETTITGIWATSNGQFYTSDNDGLSWTFVGEYIVDNERMMFRQPQGNKLWERQY